MSYAQSLLGILLSAILTENFILVKFYGICPFMGVSKKIDTALGMGMAVTFVMALASAACWAINLLLLRLNLAYMQTVAFILVIASLVQLVEMFLKKAIPTLYDAAYNRYLAEDSLKRDDLGIVQGIDQTNYDRYRDTVADSQWQQQFDYGVSRDQIADQQWQQSFDWNKYVDQWNMSNSEATQKFDQMMSKWQLTGVADNEVAAALGVPVGATTQSYYFNKAQIELDQAKLAQSSKVNSTPTAEQKEATALAESIVRNAKSLVNQTESYQKGAEYILSAVDSANEFYTIGSQAGIPNSVLQEVFDSFYNQAMKDSSQPTTTEKDYTYYAALMGKQDDPEAWLSANKYSIPSDILADLYKLLDY